MKFINPFDEGVTYQDFLDSIPKDKKIEEHLKGKLSDEQIETLKSELIIFKKNK